jgi:hypothetical protein
LLDDQWLPAKALAANLLQQHVLLVPAAMLLLLWEDVRVLQPDL